MSAAARTAAAPAAATQAASPPALQGACACGRHAPGLSGRCEACETRARLGAPAALTVGPPDDPFEREARRVAAAVAAGRTARLVVSAAEAAARRPATSPAPPSRRELAAARGAGRPLGAALRRDFEPRFGRDLSHLRLHEGPAAQAVTRALGARAVAHGRDILFAAGRLDEGSAAGRRLLAHEIAHTLQPGAGRVLRRATDAEADTPVEADPADVTLVVRENPTGAGRNTHFINNENGRFAFFRPVYPGDTVHISVEAHFEGVPEIEGPIDARFGPGEAFERADAGGRDPALVLRVLASDADAPAEEVETSVFLSAANVAGEMQVVFRFGVLPLDIDPVIARRKRKRAERKALRREQRQARRELRRERRQGDDSRDFGAEMQALRQRQRGERKAFRTGRAEAMAAARDARSAGIAAARAEYGQYACTASQRSLVERAMREAIARLESAIRHIRPGAPLDAYRSEKLRECFKVDPAAASPAELDRLQTRAKDVLTIARNSMLLSDPTAVRCGAPKGECGPRAAAFVTDFVRGNPVTVCQIWLDDNLEFEATKLEPGHERAYALIHEFCHLAGVRDQSDETYLHEPQWQGLSGADAQTMADAYAAFAWYMSSPGLE